MSSLRHALSRLIDVLRKNVELTKAKAKVREDWKRLKNERLERERLDAIYRMQEVDSDLSPDDQAELVDLFKEEHDNLSCT